jgi:hypothetical protein
MDAHIGEAELGSAVFLLVLYPLWGPVLLPGSVAPDDPEGHLEGTGSPVHSILVDKRAAILDDRDIRGVMVQALKLVGAELRTGCGPLVLKSKIAARLSGSVAD